MTITNALLVANLRHGGEDRPTIEEHTWDSVILDAATKAQLQELQYLLEDPDAAGNLGIEPPSGVLLAGPPGNGKTTIAKVLAAQARCSFYPVSAADITSKWYGQSEENIARLFERARENRPSIIFIDELDGLAPHRGEMNDATDRVLGELLSEIDGMAGQRGILVVGASNRPDQIDPALLRGGPVVTHDHDSVARRAGAARDAALVQRQDAARRSRSRGFGRRDGWLERRRPPCPVSGRGAARAGDGARAR